MLLGSGGREGERGLQSQGAVEGPRGAGHLLCPDVSAGCLGGVSW